MARVTIPTRNRFEKLVTVGVLVAGLATSGGPHELSHMNVRVHHVTGGAGYRLVRAGQRVHPCVRVV